MSVLSTCTTATSMCFVDLATFAEVDGFQYGGPNAITWFVASVQKANWFSFIPITLRFVSGTPDFAQRNVAASCNRSGDYILSIWFRALIPPIGLVITDIDLTFGAKIRWVENLMHNLFEKVQISFNELVVQEFDNYWLDNNFEFRIPGSKRVGYNNMIGNIGPMIIPVAQNQPLGTGGYFSCPLPFWFSQDSGLALPIAALPFNDVKVIYCFRNYTELVTINPGLGASRPRSTTSRLGLVPRRPQLPRVRPLIWSTLRRSLIMLWSTMTSVSRWVMLLVISSSVRSKRLRSRPSRTFRRPRTLISVSPTLSSPSSGWLTTTRGSTLVRVSMVVRRPITRLSRSRAPAWTRSSSLSSSMRTARVYPWALTTIRSLLPTTSRVPSRRRLVTTLGSMPSTPGSTLNPLVAPTTASWRTCRLSTSHRWPQSTLRVLLVRP